MNDNLGKQNTIDDEVDLGSIFKAIENFFKNVLLLIVNIIKFYWKQKFVLIGIIILGLILGYFWEKSFDKTYKNELLVIPNFESTNYLYSKVKSINSKLSIGDTIFLENVFGKPYENLIDLEIVPIIDIYNFVSKSESNKDVFELLFDEESSLEFLEDPTNSINYQFHNINVSVKGNENHEEISAALINYLNDNQHFNSLKDISSDNLDYQIIENRKMISQIDSILHYSQSNKSLSIEDSKLSFSDNMGLNELIQMKRDLLSYDRYLHEIKIEQSAIVKLVDANYKTLNNKNFLNKSKLIIFPLLFILIYSLVYLFKYIYSRVLQISS